MLPPRQPSQPRSPDDGLLARLDRHAHPESRASRYLDFVRSITQVATAAGLLALAVQLHQANVTARRDAYNRSVDASLLIDQLDLSNPDLACALLPEGPEQNLDPADLRAMRYLELNLDLHARLWQQHREGILDGEEWEAWERWFRNGVVTGEMFPAVWEVDRDYYEDDFARYVDGVVAGEVARRAAATVAAGGAPTAPKTLADYASTPSAATAC